MSLVNPYSSQSLPQQALASSNTGTVSKNTVQSNTTSTTTGNPFLDGIRLPDAPETPAAKDQMLKQEDFFALLSQQLSMQDPFKPVDNDQMIAQMASFSTVDGISNLNKEILNLNGVMSSSQALQASSLVGRKVLIPSDTGAISPASPEIKGVVSTPAAIDKISIRIEDESGQLIKTFEIDGSAGGNVDVAWDGLDKNGKPVVEGAYVIKASGKVDGQSQDLPVSTYAHVTSVSLGTAATGAILNLRGIGGIKLTDVLAVSES
ncbi:flagellar hook assembly protein FlgD [Shewanella glacialimarina]|jgi:flagellar basal-body rod modification protein FlgD|uniref:flagellar hook assembly protein FlgD n=1 Tax=Shewanella glacialimarina TaxID=2590884 RepID=UPI001CF8D44B|nr:flagellar hook assembly protein FlgD [Shewanella glacialimarina]UCX05340.1 flagellar hook assembly protein FlgD [Shewanella glacialimarina]